MKKHLATLAMIAFLVACLAGACSAKVLLCGGDYESGTVEGYLVGTGLFTAGDIDYWNAADSTPTVAELGAYDSVLVWVNYELYDPTALGNNLADYVDAGGGVVLGGWCWYPLGNTLGGDILSSLYSPFAATGDSNYDGSTLGTYDAAHPLMAGVGSLSGAFGRDIVTLNAGATLVASWDDGQPLVGTMLGGQVVGIALYPGESTMNFMGGDYARLFANALTYTSTPVPEPSSMMALAGGLLGLAGLVRRRRR